MSHIDWYFQREKSACCDHSLTRTLGFFTNPDIALLQPGITFHALSWQLASWCGARTLSPVPHCRVSVPLWGGLVTSWAVAFWLTVSELLWEQRHVWVLANESIGTASICIASRNISSTKEWISTQLKLNTFPKELQIYAYVTRYYQLSYQCKTIPDAQY